MVMKKNTNQLTAAITAGAFNSKGSNDHQKGWDGDKYQLDLNYGTKIGSNGFINFTGSLMSRGDTRRANAATGTILMPITLLNRELCKMESISILFFKYQQYTKFPAYY